MMRPRARKRRMPQSPARRILELPAGSASPGVPGRTGTAARAPTERPRYRRRRTGTCMKQGAPMNEIYGTARIVIHEGKLEEFKHLAERCVEIVHTKDSRTLEYDLFLNADGTECFVHERYRDSAAGLEHMTNIGPMTEPLSQACTMTGEGCGGPRPGPGREVGGG